MQEQKKQDGRRNNGAKPGENRGAGRKPRNPNEGARISASPTFKPSHWAAIKATGRPLTDILDEALDFQLSPTAEKLEVLVDLLTQEERVKLFGNYCTYCGDKTLSCYCMRDD